MWLEYVYREPYRMATLGKISEWVRKSSFNHRTRIPTGDSVPSAVITDILNSEKLGTPYLRNPVVVPRTLENHVSLCDVPQARSYVLGTLNTMYIVHTSIRWRMNNYQLMIK